MGMSGIIFVMSNLSKWCNIICNIPVYLTVCVFLNSSDHISGETSKKNKK